MVRALILLRLAPITFVLAVFVLSALGLAGAWAVAQDATILGVILWMLPSVVVGALITVYGTALLQGALAGSNFEIERQVAWRKGRIMILVFAAFSVTVSVAGYAYVRDLETNVRRQRLDEQRAIAALKASAIDKWLFERWIDVQLLANAMKQFPQDWSNLPAADRSLAELFFAEFLAGVPDRMAVRLLAPDGQALVEVGESVRPAGQAARPLQSAGSGAVGRRLEEWRTAEGRLRLDFILPLVQPTGSSPLFLAVSIDPEIVLWPEVKRWPVASASSSVALIEREGDAVTYVMPVRDAPFEPRRSFSIPLSQDGVISVQAVLKGSGLYEGLDYRGVPVLAAARRVKETDWIVIAKTDIAEALSPIDRRTQLVIWLTAAAVLVAAAIMFGLWRTDQASYSVLREKNAREKEALRRHYEHVMGAARDYVFLLDEDQRVVEANGAAVEAYGYTLEELRGMHATAFRSPTARTGVAADWAMGLSTGKPIETVHRRKDGREFPVEVSIGQFELDGHTYTQAFVRDVAYRKRLEAEVKRLARVETALRRASRVLLRAKTEAELYQGMCAALVEIGGYRLANVALANDEPGKTVRFAAIAGLDDGYLDQTRITWGEGPRSKGPTGAAIRTGEVQVNQDFASNPTVAPWREEALKRGIRASIGLPLIAGGQVFGALTIYAEQPDAFNRDEVELLTQFAADISYGVANIRRRHHQI